MTAVLPSRSSYFIQGAGKAPKVPVEKVEDRVVPLEDIKLHGFSARAVAEELALLDASLLRMIKTSELENGAWMKKDKVGFRPGHTLSLHS